MEGEWDAIIDVVDASQLARSLDLTLELRELARPMLVCLNMMDEAARKGMTIAVPELAAALGVPVVEAVASRGRGIVETLRAAIHLSLQDSQSPRALSLYGCSVPAVMATRILHSRRDRFVVSFLAILVACSERQTVIMALVGFYLGANWALAIYALSFVIVALAGVVLARLWPEISPGMLMEVPPYRRPGLRVVLRKTWWRLREFVMVVTPLLVIGSVLLSAMEYLGWDRSINAALSPLTALLGLPAATGLTLIFGIMRKEMSLLMLMQALGTSNIASVMAPMQIMIFTLFVTFYFPCVATFAIMLKEVGWKLTVWASVALLSLALVISLAARAVFQFLV